MVDVAPFHALRYRDLARLAAVTAPPYDTIDSELSERLHTRSPYNVVRLELDANRSPERNLARYAAAAQTYARWRAEGILELDPGPTLYVYEQAYEYDAVIGRQRGVLVALRLEAWETRAVLPHERVFPGPVEDRLWLLEALPVNTSPVYLLATREPEQVAGLLDAVTTTPPLTAFSDLEDGARHRLWRVTDREAHASVRAGYADQRLLMADGHHRYTTGLEHLARHPPAEVGEGADRILAFVVGGEGPIVRATHRLVRWLPADFDARLRAAGFDRVPLGATTAASVGAVMAALEDPPPPDPDDCRPSGYSSAPTVAFGLLTSEGSALVVVRDAERVSELWAAIPQPLRSLDVALLQRLLTVALEVEDHSDRVVFTSDPAEAANEVAAGRAAGLFLVRPATVAQVWGVAEAGVLLPPKSTSFFPKPRTGLVLRPLGP